MTQIRSGLAAYITVTAAYWAFMLTDGALRMLVLLQFHILGFSPIQLAYMFLLYEFMGVVTNLSAGWLAARLGLAYTLYIGLGMQILALSALSRFDPSWPTVTAVVFVMLIQGVSGIAKDLAKMSAKSAVKILAPTEKAGSLFRWVALLTGSKNAVKGAGFLLGAGLLGSVGFVNSVTHLSVMLLVVMLAVIVFTPTGLSAGKKSVPFGEVFSRSRDINRLSAARMFLFGARDVWFVVGVPIYFYGVLSDGSAEGNRSAFFLIGGFMALWIIGYGVVQALAPHLLRAKHDTIAATVHRARVWVGGLALIPALLALAALWVPSEALTGMLIAGLLVFGGVFAINSSLHSYLILAFSTAERVSMDVGFYYMSNAAGRLLGTLLSGLSYQFGGLPLCLATAAAMATASWICAIYLSRQQSAVRR